MSARLKRNKSRIASKRFSEPRGPTAGAEPAATGPGGEAVGAVPAQSEPREVSATAFFLRWFGLPMLVVITLIIIHKAYGGS